MSECGHAERLGAYLDGELPGGAAAEMRRHVGQCSSCAAELERLAALSRLLGPVAPMAMPSAALAGMHRMVDRMGGAGLRRIAEVLAGVAAAVLLACSVALATLSEDAVAGESMPVWEVAAVSRPGSDATIADPQEQLALWTVEDLSLDDSHD